MKKHKQSDEEYHQKNNKYSVEIKSNKLYLQINDEVIYTGYIQITPYLDIQELRSHFEKGNFQILSKTASRMNIKLGYIKLEMISDECQQIEELKAKITQLQKNLKKENAWQDEDLDSKDEFDIECIYKITSTKQGFGAVASIVQPTHLYFFAAGTNYYIPATNRRALNHGKVISKIQKKKL